MDVMELINYLEEEIRASGTVPFSDKCLTDRQKCLDLINDIKDTLPRELEEAHDIMQQHDTILAEAEREAESIRIEAENQARELTSRDQITLNAQQQAQDMLSSAQRSAQEIRNSADLYADDILSDLESYVQRSLDMVHQSRQQMRGR